MPLFHKKVVETHATQIGQIPSAHQQILAQWSKNVLLGVFDSETQNDAEFIQRILIEVLGYTGSSSGATWTLAKNQSVGKGNVDVALGSFTADAINILAPFELKGAKTRDLDATMPGRNKSPVEQAWEYATDIKGAQWILVSNYREVRLYAMGFGRKDYESFDLSKLGDQKEYARFSLLLSADNLLSGKTSGLLRESVERDKDVTSALYKDYKHLRFALVKAILADNSKVVPTKAISAAQTILDRVLFVAFAEDKGLLPSNTLKKAYDAANPFMPQPIWDNFRGLFRAIDEGNSSLGIPGYNGGLFSANADIDGLKLSDELCEHFRKLGEYDYETDVSANILGHIFEQSVTDIEEIHAGFDGGATSIDPKKGKRKKEGIYYTPTTVTQYIVEQALGGWLRRKKDELGFSELPELTDEDYDTIKPVLRGKNKGTVVHNKNIGAHIAVWEAYKAVVSRVRVLDPACGSGAFLIEVFDFLHREGEVINNQLAVLNGGQAQLFRWDKHILANNIFGVDINEESIEITKLSLWLKTASRTEKLTYLDDNIKRGNSLVSEKAIAGDLALAWPKAFPNVMSAGGFDVIVGNPPYIDSEEMVRSGQSATRDFIASTYDCARGNWDIYIAFFERAFSLLAPNGLLCFISPDKWLSKSFGEVLRVKLLPHIRAVLKLGRDVFEEAIVDSIVTTIDAREAEKIALIVGKDGEFVQKALVDKVSLDPANGLDQLFSDHGSLISKLEGFPQRLKHIALCESACATADAYVLKTILTDTSGQPASATEYKIANTGTLDKYVFRWGKRHMTYLKDKYLSPIVPRQAFQQTFGKDYQRRAKSPKLIIKGLTLMDAALDLDGDFVPGKSTLVITHHNSSTLKTLAALVNSKLFSLYINEKYSSSSYNGGVVFNKEMLNEAPVPPSILDAGLSVEVEKIVSAADELATHSYRFVELLKSEFAISEVGRKLEQWQELETTSFLAEVQKRGASVSLKQKAEWQVFFEEQKKQALRLKRQIDIAQERIDASLYTLYGLSAQEVAYVKAYVRGAE